MENNSIRNLRNLITNNQENSFFQNTNIHRLTNYYNVATIKSNTQYYFPHAFNLKTLTKEDCVYLLKHVPISNHDVMLQNAINRGLIIPTTFKGRFKTGKNQYTAREIQRLENVLVRNMETKNAAEMEVLNNLFIEEDNELRRQATEWNTIQEQQAQVPVTAQEWESFLSWFLS
jgi:hypothetical protein